jgi:hypothetical protein
LNVVQRSELSPWGFPGRLDLFTTFYGRRFDVEGGIFQQGKSCSLPDQAIWYQNTVFGDKADQPGKPMVLIDNMTRLRRDAAPIPAAKIQLC